ncbi:MAG: hypothetical protein JSW05_06725 [Candidatus Thorarchaeota archaeon]|nr:MAG: hypothetical protein JSW05_06725 [Candidatus Thorarchaeota archaeon]
MQESDLGTFGDDVRVGFKFAVKNVLSLFLAMIGVLIVTVFVLVIILLGILTVIMTFGGGFPGVIRAIMVVAEAIETFPSPASLGIIAMVLIPLVLPLFVAIGALYGMAREIVESEGTSAEGVFTWYERKFVSLAGAGILIFLISILPLGLGYLYISEVLGWHLVGTDEALAIAAAVGWFLLTGGLLSMMFPAIIDGHSVKDAFVKSVGMGARHASRVFSLWIFYLGLAVVLFAPLIWGPIYAPWTVVALATGSLGFYPVLVSLFLLFILIPAMAISQSRAYLLLSSDEDEEPLVQETRNDLERWGAVN